MLVFCCAATQQYRPIRTDHEGKFDRFLQWANGSRITQQSDGQDYVIQAVRQVNFGPIEEISYFRSAPSGYDSVDEAFVIGANLKKTNSYKNYRCSVHNKFFEINLYTKSAESKHHWRADVARPASNIDLGRR